MNDKVLKNKKFWKGFQVFIQITCVFYCVESECSTLVGSSTISLHHRDFIPTNKTFTS